MMASAGVSKKRKSDMTKFYAVRAGHRTGVMQTWDDCKECITGYKGAVYKSFITKEEAEDFVAGRDVPSASATNKFYGVAAGKNIGVYTSWADAEAQIKGWKNPKYRKFATMADAEAFVESNGKVSKAAADEDKIDVDANEPPKKRVRRSMESDDTYVDIETTVISAKMKASNEDDPIKIYTDGSSLGNGKTGAAAGLGVWFGPGDERNISERLVGEPQTNQRAELCAILRALEKAPLDKPVAIYTDSNYSINCVTTWFTGWESRGWLTSQNKPVMNRDLIELVLTKIRERAALKAKTYFNWIKGHSNDPGNEAADRLAVSGARMPCTEVPGL